MSYLLSHYTVVLLLLIYNGSFELPFVASLFLLTPLLHPSIRQRALHPFNHQSAYSGLFWILWLFLIPLGTALLSTQGQWSLWMLHFLWVIIPEEFFFRTFFWRALNYEECSRFQPIRITLFNSLIFTIFHLSRSVSLENLLIFFPGLALAWAYSRFRSFSLNCIMHLNMNLIYAVYMEL